MPISERTYWKEYYSHRPFMVLAGTPVQVKKVPSQGKWSKEFNLPTDITFKCYRWRNKEWYGIITTKGHELKIPRSAVTGGDEYLRKDKEF